MIDTHIHMVPGVDDGAKNLDRSVRMLNMAINEGVNEMIVTPHFKIPLYDNQNVEKQFRLISDYIVSENINFKIHLGNEIYLSEESMEGIKKGQANTMGNSRYLLLELPYYHFYPFHESMMAELQERGYEIILAHVERYQIFESKPEKLKEFVEKGIYTQITSRYISDKKTRKDALKLINNGLIHVVASDGHDTLKRPPVMKEAYQIVSRAFGESSAQTLFTNNPKLIIKNGALILPHIEKAKRFSLWNLRI